MDVLLDSRFISQRVLPFLLLSHSLSLAWHKVVITWQGEHTHTHRHTHTSQSLQHRCSSIRPFHNFPKHIMACWQSNFLLYLIKLGKFPSFQDNEGKRKLKAYLSFGFTFISCGFFLRTKQKTQDLMTLVGPFQLGVLYDSDLKKTTTQQQTNNKEHKARRDTTSHLV